MSDEDAAAGAGAGVVAAGAAAGVDDALSDAGLAAESLVLVSPEDLGLALP